MSRTKRTSQAKSPNRTGPPKHILQRLCGQRSLEERFRDSPGEELTRAQAMGTWLNFFCDYAVYPEVHRDHYAAVHKAATDYLIRLADAHGIDGTALHHAGVICRQLAKKQELRDKTAGCLWPDCLGEHRYTLPETQQNAIEAGERVIQKLRLKVGFKAEVDDSEILTKAMAAKRLGVTCRTLRRWMDEPAKSPHRIEEVSRTHVKMYSRK